MQLKNILILLASAFAVSAAPADDVEKRGGGYTCGQAYEQCQGQGKGMYVCYADNNSHTCGQYSGYQMSTPSLVPTQLCQEH